MLTPYAFNTADGQFRQVKSTARSAASLPSRSRAAHHNSQARGSAELSKKKGSLNAHTHKQHLLLPATRTMAAPTQNDAPTSSGHRTSAWVSLGLHAVLLLNVASFLLLELQGEVHLPGTSGEGSFSPGTGRHGQRHGTLCEQHIATVPSTIAAVQDRSPMCRR